MITLSWNDVTGETGYTLERSLNSTQWSVLTTPSANVVTYQNTGLTPSTLYYYRLKSENASGSSDYTSVSSARTHDPNSPPSAPTNLAGSIIGIGITLSWTDNSNNEDSFIVYRSVNNGPSTQLVELPANTTAYGDTQVQLGSNYKYSVKAKNAYGLSSASNDLPILMNCQ
jgi:titin